jgi:hypothetical protein
VVDACEPASDRQCLKEYYCAEPLSEDGAIDRIWRKLCGLAELLPKSARKKRKAVAAAVS